MKLPPHKDSIQDALKGVKTVTMDGKRNRVIYVETEFGLISVDAESKDDKGRRILSVIIVLPPRREGHRRRYRFLRGNANYLRELRVVELVKDEER